MKRIQFLAIPLLAVLMGIALLLPLSAGAASAKAASSGTLTAPASGTIPSIGGTFSGNFVPAHFSNQQGKLYVTGTLEGTLYNATGNVIGTVTQPNVTLPVTSASGTCQILYLHTGEITLTLLGLTVDISPITITITANPAGGLLGQLLCDIANLLNSGAPLGSLAGLLNQVLAALGL